MTASKRVNDAPSLEAARKVHKRRTLCWTLGAPRGRYPSTAWTSCCKPDRAYVPNQPAAYLAAITAKGREGPVLSGVSAIGTSWVARKWTVRLGNADQMPSALPDPGLSYSSAAPPGVGPENT
jgi:hypothetical protein